MHCSNHHPLTSCYMVSRSNTWLIKLFIMFIALSLFLCVASVHLLPHTKPASYRQQEGNGFTAVARHFTTSVEGSSMLCHDFPSSVRGVQGGEQTQEPLIDRHLPLRTSALFSYAG